MANSCVCIIESTGAPFNAPSDVTLSAVNGTFVTVTWTVLDGVSGYEIVVNPVSPGGTPTTVKVRSSIYVTKCRCTDTTYPYAMQPMCRSNINAYR